MDSKDSSFVLVPGAGDDQEQRQRVIQDTSKHQAHRRSHLDSENQRPAHSFRAHKSTSNLRDIAASMGKRAKREEELGPSGEIQAKQIEAEIVADYMRDTPPAPRVLTTTAEMIGKSIQRIPSPLHLQPQSQAAVGSPLGSPSLDTEFEQKRARRLSFPLLQPRGVPTVALSPTSPFDQEPTRVVNGVVLSRDMINRMVHLYKDEHRDKYWTIAQHITDEYGLVISSYTAYLALASEGVLPTERVDKPEGGTEERIIEFEEDRMFQPRIVCGQVISQEMIDRIIALFDMGKHQVSTIAQYIREEFGIAIWTETVNAVLYASDREGRWDF